MATRTTRQDVQNAFERLCEMLGRPIEAWRKDEHGKTKAVIGAWYLDWNPPYGGVIINEMVNEGGGVKNPMGNLRMKPAEFVAAVRFAEDAIHNDRRNR